MAFGQPRRPPSPDFLSAMGQAIPPDPSFAPQPDLSIPPPGIMGQATTTPTPALPNISSAMRGAVRKPSLLGILADALSGAAGTTPMYAQSLLMRRQQDMQEQQYENRLRFENQLKQTDPYHVADADGNIVEITPGTGASRIVYRGAPKLTGTAAEIKDLRDAGATPEQIQAFVANKVDPIHMAAQTDAATGQTTLTPYRSSQFGQPSPPRVLSALPPGAVPLNDGGPSPTRSAGFPKSARAPRRAAN